ncbi:3'-5' exonuclease [Paenibacillus chondroitinus]|uniref:DNA 3'-5' helicase n=1 Tax=Paenibacillus chondroitinus TaxID=59842 RepID=A0ABU6DHG7_9BACL|nr:MULTISPECIES: 3'-5' exonuclease [Paenibacillus]MCY9658490.1 UvrD-helicase domain-containing protein [Paenibacillus anseongense]MEB4797202.1 3'-5' exonuclease [Paenibacillus chondroitinus]
MSLPVPEGLQSEVLYLPEKGHFVVLGTAGSGKTTLAILRSAYLASTHCKPGERVMLVTFNKALVTYLKSISDSRYSNVDVLNYHKFARGYLNSRNKMGWGVIASSDTKNDLIKKALTRVRFENPNVSTLERNSEVFIEEISWLEKMGIRTLEQYESVERIGRSGTWIARANRKYFFYVYLEYLELRAEEGHKYDFEDLALHVCDELKVDSSKRMYKHIILDEGQDFSPMMLLSLALAVPKDGSLTYFGDVAQQIYGSRISWRSAGLVNPRIWRFEQNYRNTREIASLGLAISKMKYFHEDTDLIEPKFSRASGPKPALLEFNSEKDELDFFIENVIRNNRTRTIAILVRDRETVNQIINKVRQIYPIQELYGEMSRWLSDPRVSVGTYHSAKGLEFDTVILPYCNSLRLPAEERILALESYEEALSEEIKLLYVGVTRAKSELYISYSGALTELLPRERELYHEDDEDSYDN